MIECRHWREIPDKDLSWIDDVRYVIINDSHIPKLIDKIKAASVISVDIETTGLDPYTDKIVGLSLSFKEETAIYIPVGHAYGENVSEDSFKELLIAMNGAKVVGHNIGFDWKMLYHLYMRDLGVDFDIVADSMIMCQILIPEQRGHSLERMSQCYLSLDTATISEMLSVKKKDIKLGTVSLMDTDSAESYWYGCCDADTSLRLYNHLLPFMTTIKDIFKLETSLIKFFATMELNGVLVDEDYRIALVNEYTKRKHDAEQKIYKLAGREFNINSGEQLGKVLFEEHGLPVIKRTAKKGIPSVDGEVIDKLAEQGHDIARTIQEFSRMDDLLSKSLAGLQQHRNPVTGRVHANIRQAAATSGRTLIDTPNMQNWPARYEEGYRVRGCFVPAPGYIYVDVDFSQIEYRIPVSMAKEEWAMKAFEDGEDFHTTTTALLFNIPKDKVTKELRDKGKTLNFGLLYGMSAYNLANRVGITPAEAESLMRRYFERIPRIKKYIADTHRSIQDTGYVTTAFGRRRWITGILKAEDKLRKHLLGAGFNTSIQGTAADILKIASHRVSKAVDPRYTKWVLTVHDELLFEVDVNHVHEEIPKIRKAMEVKIPGFVPFVTEVAVGWRWNELKVWDGTIPERGPKVINRKEDTAVESPAKPEAIVCDEPYVVIHFEKEVDRALLSQVKNLVERYQDGGEFRLFIRTPQGVLKRSELLINPSTEFQEELQKFNASSHPVSYQISRGSERVVPHIDNEDLEGLLL